MLLRMLIAILRLISSRGSKGELRHSDVRSLLVVELSRLGDVVSMLAVVPGLIARFPNAHIHLLVDEQYASLLEGLQLSVHVHPTPNSRSLRGLLRTLFLVRQLIPDIAINVSPSKRNAIVVLGSGATYKAGYLGYIDSVTPFLLQSDVGTIGFSPARAEPYGRENIYERARKVVRPLGVATSVAMKRLELSSDVVDTVSSQLLQRGVLPSKPYVAVHPLSGWEFRSWSIDRFSSLAEWIVNNYGQAVVFVYSARESPQIERVKARFKGSGDVYFFPSSDLLETAVVLQRATLFVGNDSGPLHLAAALGVKVVGLFGPAEPALTAPLSENAVFLYKRVECSPCEQRVCVRPEDPCMGLISVDEVSAAVADCLAGSKSEAATTHA